MNKRPKLNEEQERRLKQKQALEEFFNSPNGDLFLEYLGSLCLSDFGSPKKDAYEYAYSEGRRNVLSTLLQIGNRDINVFLKDMIKKQEDYDARKLYNGFEL